ncbi:radical SAM protein [Candidatus Omnitrophota bacterium]
MKRVSYLGKKIRDLHRSYILVTDRNMAYTLRSIARKSQEGRSKHALYPETIYIVVNNSCNLKCKMCDYGQGDSGFQFYKMTKRNGPGELDIARLKVLIDEVRSFRPLIAVTSTEPLMYKDILEFLIYVKSKKLKMQITTNGFLLPRFAEELVKDGLDILWVSLDGPESVHNEIRGNKESYKNAIEGIQRIISYKQKNNKKKPAIYINYTITDHNYHCLYEFMKAIDGLDLISINFSHMNYISRDIADSHNSKFSDICKAYPSSILSTRPENVDTQTLLEQIQLVKKHYPEKAYFVPDLNLMDELDTYYKRPEICLVSKGQCLVPWRAAQILANGDCVTMTRCYDLVFGNIYKNSFKSIWNDERYKQWRKVLSKHGSFLACSRCCGIF